MHCRLRISGPALFLALIPAHLLGPPRAVGEAVPIFLDGNLDDWSDVSPSAHDAWRDGGPSGVDFGRLWLANDGQHLFLRIEVGIELRLQESNDIVLYIDTDNNTSTGNAVGEMGADLMWDFGNRTGTFDGSAISWDAAGVVSAPSHSARDFEIALRRDATPNGGGPLFRSTTIRILIRENAPGGDWVPGRTAPVSYTFDNGDPLNPALIGLAKDDPDDVRIMTYNVYFDGLWSQAGEHTRILRAIEPDIIAYQEIYNHEGSETRSWVQARLPGRWYLSWEGERQTLSRWPILQSWETGAGRAHATLIDLPTTSDRDLLLINLHLSCCLNDASRQQQIDEVMSFVRDAQSPGGSVTVADGTAIVIVGDTNMYGDVRQVETLLTGDISDNGTYGPDFAPDWDGSDLVALLSRQPRVRQSYTWYDEGSSYGPSHIDRITYTGSVMEVAKSYLLHTPLLDAAVLAAAGLNADDSRTASDHIPHVFDFAAGESTSARGEVPVSPAVLLENHPNPFNPTTTISFFLPERIFASLEIFNTRGELVERLMMGELPRGDHAFRWDAGDEVPSGVYFSRLRAGPRHLGTTKMTLVR